MTTSRKRSRTIDEYIASFPKHVEVLERIRRAIRESAPEAEEAISYGIPAFRRNGRDLVYFAAWKKHDFEQFRMGLEVELEHGNADPRTNVANNDPILTDKIAWPHLNELPD